MPSLYLETTIPSYLGARPSRDLIVAAHQQITHEWWAQAKVKFDLYISQAVLDEIILGDEEAAARRLDFIKDLPILPLTDNTKTLAGEYITKLRLPQKASLDAVHLACAVENELDYLLTWNCKHLAHGEIIQRLQVVNLSLGLPTPIILTPEELL
jgi:predicted nucleic acid-binding protein